MKLKNPFALPERIPTALPMNRTLGNPRGLYSWSDWMRDMKRKYPVRYFLSRTLPEWVELWRRLLIGTPLYWLRCHTLNRYHMVDLRNEACDYHWGWIDRSEAVLYACFNLLKDFVEKEKAFECHINWNSDARRRLAKKEMLALYRWWTGGRKTSWEKYEKKKSSLARSKAWTMLEAKDDEMLQRLIAVRGMMWT